MAGVAARALAARQVVDERDAAAVDLGDDLVPEHGARRCAAELLDVRPAEAAGDDAGERPGAVRLGDLLEPRLPLLVEYDGAHRSIVGRWQIKLHRCNAMWVKIEPASVLAGAEGAERVRDRVRLVKRGLRVQEARAGRRPSSRPVRSKFPWIEFEDGSVYREESADMAETIRAGKLDEKRAGPPA